MMLAPLVLVAAASLTAQQSVTLNAPGTPEHAPTVLTGCFMPAGGTTSMPGSGGSSGTGPAGMNADAANSGVFFAIKLGKKKKTADTSYSLVGLDTAQLAQYAHSRVEVQGALVPPPNPAGVGNGVSMRTTATTAKAAPQFRVTAIKQVPGSCGGQ